MDSGLSKEGVVKAVVLVKIFKWPKNDLNREDSSDCDENLTESNAEMKTFICQIFRAVPADFRWFQKILFAKFREKLFE